MQNYNLILSVDDVSESAPTIADYPVTKEEVKNYFRLQGFEDSDGSISTFDTDDDLIDDLIIEATEAVEDYCNISIVNRTIKAVVTNLAGYQELPKGPVVSITSFKDSDDNDISTSDYDLIGESFKQIVSPNYELMKITYAAGYGDAVPKGLKNAILAEIAYRFIHRGDEMDDNGICQSAMQRASRFKRDGWLV